MDSAAFFKRKGLYKDRKTDAVFKDNPARALFFARAALSTAEKLGWNPDVVHASGWIAALVPHVLRDERGGDELFADARSVFTPDVVPGYEPTLGAEEAAELGLPEAWAGRSLRQIGLETAAAAAYAPGDAPATASRPGRRSRPSRSRPPTPPPSSTAPSTPRWRRRRRRVGGGRAAAYPSTAVQ